ncbi:hypothetical protein PMEGAPL103_55130 [Priestia megaterium]
MVRIYLVKYTKSSEAKNKNLNKCEVPKEKVHYEVCSYFRIRVSLSYSQARLDHQLNKFIKKPSFSLVRLETRSLL